MKLEEIKITSKVYEIILGEYGHFSRLEEIIKPISTKYLNIGGDSGVGGYTTRLYYILEDDTDAENFKWRLISKDLLFFSHEVK